jgi:hypothetical protein
MVIGVYDILWKEIGGGGGGGGGGERRSYIIYMASLLLSPSCGMPDSILSPRATSTPTSSSSMTISATLVADLDDYPSNYYSLKHVLLERVYNWVLM